MLGPCRLELSATRTLETEVFGVEVVHISDEGVGLLQPLVKEVSVLLPNPGEFVPHFKDKGLLFSRQPGQGRSTTVATTGEGVNGKGTGTAQDQIGNVLSTECFGCTANKSFPYVS